MRRQSIDLKECGITLESLGHSLSDEKLVEVAKKVKNRNVTLDGKFF